MVISQQFIDLLNVPLPRLKRIASDLGVEVESGAGKWEIAEALSELPRERLVAVAGDWLFAGSTSVTWLRLGEGHAVDVSTWKEAVNDYLNADVDADDIRPEQVTNKPKLVDMYELSDGKIVCTFAVAKRVSKVIHNFEMSDVYQDEFFVAVVRLEDGVVEVRGSHERALRLARTWLGEIAERLPEATEEAQA